MKVGVIYGGRSVEHDVSVLTALQAIDVLAARHEPVPIYISRSGRWWTGAALLELETYAGGGEPDAEPIWLDLEQRALVPREGGGGRRRKRSAAPVAIDAVLNASHGTYGEDGALAGLFELAQIPYTGCGVGAAAVAMDKALTKSVLREAGVPVVEYRALGRAEWERDRDAAISGALAAVPLPVYVKPASLGSSIGVARCTDAAEITEALELVFELDETALIERSVEDAVEVNCAVLGRPGTPARTSVCEQPVSSAELLSFEDKYLRGANKVGDGEKEADSGAKGMASAERIIPAPIGSQATARVQALATRAFTALGCAGVARVDLLLDKQSGEPVVNELNTVPGSFSFYLWEPAGLPFPDLLDELLRLATERHAEAERTTRTFDSNLLAARGGGSKGSR